MKNEKMNTEESAKSKQSLTAGTEATLTVKWHSKRDLLKGAFGGSREKTPRKSSQQQLLQHKKQIKGSDLGFYRVLKESVHQRKKKKVCVML